MKPISRTIAIWLGTIIIISGISSGMLYSCVQVDRYRNTYLKQINSEADFIANELAVDLWTYDKVSIEHISQTIINLANVTAIRIWDDAGETLFSKDDTSGRDGILLENKIRYHDRDIGRIQITFAPFDSAPIWEHTLITIVTVLMPVLFASVLLTTLILKICLSNPLCALLNGIKLISDGRHRTISLIKGGLELNTIAESINSLSEKLCQRENNLRESLEKYKVLFNSFPLGITVTDPRGNILETNSQAEALLGVPKHDHEQRSIGGSVWKIIRPDGTDMPEEEFASVRALKENRLIENSEHGFLRSDGRVIWLNVTAAPIPLETYGIVVAYGDITERKRLERDLHAYKNIVSSTDDFISLIDPGYVYRIVNDSYLRLNQKRSEEIVGHPVADLVGEEIFNTMIKKRFDRCIRGEIVRFQSWFDYAEEGRRCMDITYSPYMENGTVNGITVNGRDVTEQKRVEERLMELNATLEKRVAERTALADRRTHQLRQLAIQLNMAEDLERRRLAAVLHDDLQQHLAYIKIRANLAAAAPEGTTDTAARREFQEIENLVQAGIDKCRSLCYELTPPELYRGGLLQALECVMDDLFEKHGLRVDLEAAPDSEPESSILASMIFRSIKELLNNVVKHSGADTAAIEMTCTDDHILVSVTDPGGGCDLGEVRSRKGADGGFGLFNIGDRMKFLGGRVEFKSAPGNGFHALLKVPRKIDIPSEMHLIPVSPVTGHELSGEPGLQGQASAPIESGSIRILIADDHDLMRAGLVELLQNHSGMKVVGEAANGVDAIRMAAQLKPDVILMDVSMPQLDGIKASAEIRRTFPDIRIIGISMNTDDATRQGMLNAGACAFLSKAGSFRELIKVIRHTGR